MQTGDVDAYLRDGCGRCEHYKTPACKVRLWTAPLGALRDLLLDSGLTEELKWGSPCYTLEGRNVVMLGSFKESCALQFFRGAELTDDDGLLESPGPNSRHGRYLKFRSLQDVEERRAAAKRLVAQAIQLERSGKKAATAPAHDPIPLELERRLASDTALHRAFEALTPGRRRSHILHISGAKQTATRERRVDRCAPEILAGRGFNER